MQIGESVELRRIITPEDLAAYQRLVGGGPWDHVPAPLIAGLFSQLLGMRLPGPGTGWLKQELTHLAPARIGETLLVKAEILRLRPEKRLVDLHCSCRGNDGRMLCEGRALMLLSA